MTPPRGNKFNAVRTELDGNTFDSKREANIWADLKIRVKAGEIVNLERQVKFDLAVNDLVITTFRADFAFNDAVTGRYHVVDVKSEPTAAKRDFKLVVRLMKAIHGVDVEVMF
jgi:hypothetical protein